MIKALRSLLLVLAFALPGSLPLLAAAQAQAQQTGLTIIDAIAAATARFSGQVIAAELVAARPEEMTGAVYAFRLLTPAGDILAIRVDAQNGDILEVDGRGLVAARRRANGF